MRSLHRLLRVGLPALALAAPQAASAAPTPEQVLDAFEVDRALLVPGSLATPGSQPQMFAVMDQLGAINPVRGATMSVLSTGNTKNITSGNDYDYPGQGSDGSAGDHATLSFQLEVPEFANSFAFDFFFLTREYPEWVNFEFNDTFEVWLESSRFTGQIVFDSGGNPVNVNNGLFVVTADNAPAQLAGTGFSTDGGTGWVTTVAPCAPGEVISLRYEIYDVADGIWDSAVLLDNFRFSTDEQDDPTSDHTPTGDLRLGYPSPKEAPLEGGVEVLLHGAGFNESTVVHWGDVLLPAPGLNSGELLVISEIPSAQAAGVPQGGNIDIVVERGDDRVTLVNGFTYHDEAAGSVPPWVDSVLPAAVNPSGGTELRIRGTNFDPGARVFFITPAGEDTEASEVEAPVESVGSIEGGLQIVAYAPSHDEGWVDIVVQNADGLRSSPGYPIEVTTDAFNSGGGAGGGGGSSCGAAVGGGGAGLAALLLPGLLLRRRREVRR